MLEGEGGNIAVSVGKDGVLIVDDQFEPLVPKIREALKKLGNDRPEFLLNTHYHGDHTGGNAAFAEGGTHIIAHHNVRKRLQGDKGLPVITFDQSLSVHFNGEEIRALHFPNSHTDGDAVILFTGSNVVHTGDLFVTGRFPFVDLNGGGDVEGLVRSIQRLVREIPAGAKVIPGHGTLSTVEDVRAYLAMLEETVGIVRDRIRQGQSLEQIKAAGLPERWKASGTGFVPTDRWIETIYQSLTRRR
jgi:glyoxylase-like metal-dependent hydrolase (beta-lactamase superfamily II)